MHRACLAVELLHDGNERGDGIRPTILREADLESTDMLFCLTHDDQANIIGSLVAHSLGFSRMVTKIDDPELEHICGERQPCLPGAICRGALERTL